MITKQQLRNEIKNAWSALNAGATRATFFIAGYTCILTKPGPVLSVQTADKQTLGRWAVPYDDALNNLYELLHEKPLKDACQTEGRLMQLLKNSQDFNLYKDVFYSATSRLIRAGLLQEIDVQNQAGWTRSTDHPGMYFIYSGRFLQENKIYLEPKTGRIFKNEKISAKLYQLSRVSFYGSNRTQTAS